MEAVLGWLFVFLVFGAAVGLYGLFVWFLAWLLFGRKKSQ